jgi:hypothetical protein
MSSRYYRTLMYVELRISDTSHKKPCRGSGTMRNFREWRLDKLRRNLLLERLAIILTHANRGLMNACAAVVISVRTIKVRGERE